MPNIPIHSLGNEQKPFDKKRNSAERNEYNKLYNNRRYRSARALYLKHNPLCVSCQVDNIVTAANILDHITPHRGNVHLFWDSDNWQGLCKSCHNRKSGEEAHDARG